MSYANLQHKGIKRKDTSNVITVKRDAKRIRQVATSAASSSVSTIICSSCQQEGHKSARSRECRNYNLKLTELIPTKLGSSNYQRYTVSIPFSSFCKDTRNKVNSLEKIKDILGFIREVILKTQLFINYFIIKHPNKLTNGFFDQNFWYTISIIVRGYPDPAKIKFTLKKYRNKRNEKPNEEDSLDVDQLTNSFVELSTTVDHSLFVAENKLKNYGQSLSTACETIATTYNNYDIENYESIICNYFICILNKKYSISDKSFNTFFLSQIFILTCVY
jgi:hypothetical protein